MKKDKFLSNDHLALFNNLEKKGLNNLSALMKNLYSQVKNENKEENLYSIKYSEAFHIIDEFIILLNSMVK